MMPATPARPQRRPRATPGRAALLLAVLLAACGVPPPSSAPLSVVVGSVATATGLAVASETATATPSGAAPPPTVTLTATLLELRTKTPAPTGSATSTVPTPTRTRPGAIPATRTPTGTPGGAAAAIGPAPDTSAYGVSATFHLEARSRTYRPNQKMWFRFSIANLTGAELKYGFIGVAVSNGHFHTSWSGASLAADGTLNWRDWVSVPKTGDYTVTLAMCFSPKEECLTGGRWANLSAPVPVTVR